MPLAALLAHQLFQSLPPEHVAAISRFSHVKQLDCDEAVYGPDTKATHVFVLLDGAVELRLPDSRECRGLLVSRIQKGEFFGIAPLLDSDRYTTTACCSAKSRVVFIEARPFIQMLRANPLIGQQIMSAAARAYFDRYLALIKRIQSVLAD